MKSTTSNSASDEGTAFEIPQLDGGARRGRAPASAMPAAEAAAAGPREVADTATSMADMSGSNPEGAVPHGEAMAARRRSIVSTIRDILDAAEARAARAEERAREAEAHLALHHRHCICRAGAVARAIAAEEADGEPLEADAETVGAGPEAAAEAEAAASASGAEPVAARTHPALMEGVFDPASASVPPSGRATARSRRAAAAGACL